MVYLNALRRTGSTAEADLDFGAEGALDRGIAPGPGISRGGMDDNLEGLELLAMMATMFMGRSVRYGTVRYAIAVAQLLQQSKS